MKSSHTKNTNKSSSQGRKNNFSNRNSQGKKSHGSSKRGGGKPGGSRGGRGGRKIPTFNPAQFININPVDIQPVEYVAKHTFSDFAMDPRLVQKLTNAGITIPSPIQDQTIKEALLGRDVVGLAETGTGKTAAFLLPLIQKTLDDPNHQTLILAPTRELALQIDAELKTLSSNMKLFSVTCVGGISIAPQIRALKRSQHFVIGTPGRILDLIKRKSINPQHFNAVVLDEADRMLDMGFIHDMKSILSQTNKNRQTLFFSATMSEATKMIIHDFLRNPVMVSVKKKDVTNSIEQNIVRFGHHNKFETLLELLEGKDFSRVIIFGSMKHSVEKLSKELVFHGIKAASIHGNKSHIQRQSALEKFKKGTVQVLVATDVAARGIHVDDVSHVINYDLPQTFEDYVHRIGRTGRGSKRGKALTFIQA